MAPKATPPALGTYLLRDIDPAMWDRFAARAQADGLSMRELLVTFAEAYADGRIDVGARVVRNPARKPRNR